MHIWIKKKYNVQTEDYNTHVNQKQQLQLLRHPASQRKSVIHFHLSFYYLYYGPYDSGLTLQPLSVGLRKPTLCLLLVWCFLESSLDFLFSTRTDSHVKLSPRVTSLSLTAGLASLAIV